MLILVLDFLEYKSKQFSQHIYISLMIATKPIQSIREVYDKLTGQTGSQKRIYKDKYPAISLDSVEVTMIAKFLEKHEKELKIISEERKVKIL